MSRRSSIRTAALPSSYGGDWDGHAQYFVDKGYAWLAINYRGSTGHGSDFERANHGVWGVDDTRDCLAAADFLRTVDWVDGDRLGIFGASYGSYMALLSVTDDPEYRFRCAVCKYGDCDALTTWAQGDRAGVQMQMRIMGHPSEQRDAYLAGSPVLRPRRSERRSSSRTATPTGACRSSSRPSSSPSSPGSARRTSTSPTRPRGTAFSGSGRKSTSTAGSRGSSTGI